jgi:HEAT repeat protein
LGEIGGDLAVEQLVAILEKNEARTDVMRALGEIEDARAVPLLINALNNGNRHIREKAAFALGEIGDPRAIDPLVDIMLRDPPDEGVNGSAATALGKIGDVRAVEPWIVVLRTRKRGVPTSSSARALGELGDLRAVDPLIDLLQHPSPDVQMASAQALGELGDPRAAEPLVQLFRERNQAAAQLNFEFLIDALAKIGPPIVEPLIEALQDRDAETRAGAARILGRIRDIRAVPELTRLAREDNSFYVRQTAEEALAKIAQPLNNST